MFRLLALLMFALTAVPAAAAPFASDRISVEGSWVHMSHAQLFGRQNPGMDNIGVRLNLKL